QVIKPQRRNVLTTGQKVQHPRSNEVRPDEGRGHDNHEFLQHQRNYSKDNGDDEDENWLRLVPGRMEKCSSHNRAGTRAQQEDAEKKQPNTEDSTNQAPDDGTNERDAVVARDQRQSKRPSSGRANNKSHHTQGELDKAIAACLPDTFPYSSDISGSAAQFNGSVSAMPEDISFEFGRLRIRARRIHC